MNLNSQLMQLTCPFQRGHMCMRRKFSSLQVTEQEFPGTIDTRVLKALEKEAVFFFQGAHRAASYD